MARHAYDVMDLKTLRCFSSMARHGSLTQAGIELDISEAAVSQRVRSLETYLGAKLYESRGGRVRLTAAGERTAQLAVSLFGDIEALERAVGGAQETEQIVLSSHDSVLRYLLPDSVEAFRHAYPLARLRLIARPVAETLALVRANECDLGVIAEAPLPEDLRFQPMNAYPVYLILAKGHVLARRAQVSFPEMVSDAVTGHYPLVILEVQREDPRLRAALDRLGIPFNVALEVTTIDTLKHYVARGLGVAVISGFSVTEEDRRRLEVLRVPDELGGTTTYGVIMRRDKHHTPLLQSLLAMLIGAGPGSPGRNQTPPGARTGR